VIVIIKYRFREYPVKAVKDFAEKSTLGILHKAIYYVNQIEKKRPI